MQVSIFSSVLINGFDHKQSLRKPLQAFRASLQNAFYYVESRAILTRSITGEVST